MRVQKGNRPGYTEAASPSLANELYEQFLVEIQKLIPQKIETGKFGADMKIQLINDGPVTIIIDTKISPKSFLYFIILI